jgi:hypothetical protein
MAESYTRDYFKATGKIGGKTRAENMTADARIASARKAAKALWKQRRAVKQAAKRERTA